MTDDTNAETDDAYVPAFSEAPFGAALGSLAAIMSSVGTLAIGALMVLIVVDVLGRNFFNAPITGVAEIAGRAVVAIVFLQVAAAILQKRLTRADFLIRRLQGVSPKGVCLIEALFCIAGMIVFALIVWASWPKLRAPGRHRNSSASRAFSPFRPGPSGHHGFGVRSRGPRRALSRAR